MTQNRNTAPRRGRRGSTIIEFALVTILLCILLLAGIEFDRMVLVYTTVAHSARMGARYAIVHGSSRSGSGPDGPSSSADYSQITTVVRNFAGAGLLATAGLTVAVTYPDGNNNPGSHVSVSVSYPYDPFLTIMPLRFTLRSSTQGIILF
jgi:Flp pilus assembly protein TadG